MKGIADGTEKITAATIREVARRKTASGKAHAGRPALRRPEAHTPV
jgi:hypothetical protein